MQYAKGKMYKLVEWRNGLILLNPMDNLNRSMGKSEPLCQADSTAMTEYFTQYIHARESGKSLIEAHDIALRCARIPKIGKAPDDSKIIVLNGG